MARRKKLNVKFLVLIGIPVVLCALVIPARYIIPKYFPQVKWVFRGTPVEHEAKAKSFYDQGAYAESAEEFKRAIQLKGTADAAMYTALGDCYSHLVLVDSENVRQMIGCYNTALSTDPNYVPAMLRMLDYIEGIAESSSGADAAQAWDSVQTTASKVVVLEPDNQRAQIAQQRAVVQRWLSGRETNPGIVDEAVNALLVISQKQPFNADAILYAMQARIARGLDRMKTNDRPGAQAIWTEVSQAVDDMLAAHPDDGNAHYRAAQLLTVLGAAERSQVQGQPSKYTDRIHGELEKAASLIKPTDPHYVEVKLAIARNFEGTGDLPGALQAYRALLSEKPNSMAARRSLAEALARDPATRGEAIDVLEHIPPVDTRELVGIKAEQARRQQLAAQYILIDAKLDQYIDIRNDKPAQDAILKQVDEIYAKITTTPGLAESPAALERRGRIELVKGQGLQAVQTLDRALNLMPQGVSEQRVRVMATLASAYIVTQQTGQAKSLLGDLLAINQKNTAARLMLARLLLSEGNNAEARKNLDLLAKDQPDSIEILRLQILAMDKTADAAKIAELYTKLPEKSREERVIKSQMAVYIDRRDEAARLIALVYADDPNDFNALADLSRLYTGLGETDRALTLVDAAIAKNPDKLDLKLLQAEIAGADTGALRRDLIDKITDPLRKELLLYRLAAQDDKADEAMQHLAAAAAIKADDRQVLDLQFQNALLQKKWDLAAQYVESLAKQDADLAGGLLYRVRLAMARGSLNDAADLAQQLTRKLPQFAQSWAVLGQVQRAQGKFAESIQSYQQALKDQSNHLDAIRGLIASSYDLNEPANAKGYIDVGRRLFPNYPPLREMELQHELKFGDPQKAIAPRQDMLKKAIDAKDPYEARAWLALGDTYLAAAHAKTNPQEARPLLEQARDTYKQASAKWPDEIKFVQLYSDAALQLHANADAEKAIRDLMARPAWQGKPEPTLLLADFQGRSGKAADQEKTLRDYLTTVPTAIPVQVRLSGILAGQNKVDDALKILDVNADEPIIRRQRIELQIAANRLADAEKEINAVLASTPNPGPVLLNRQAFVYMQSGRATQALDILDKILARFPDDPEALLYRSTIFVTFRRNLDQAIHDLQAIRDLPGSETKVRAILAEAHHYAGDDESAIRELEDAVRIAPEEKGLRLRLIDFYERSTPPRWTVVERTLREARALPQMASDLDLINTESRMWLQRRDTAKATDVVNQGRKIAPNDMRLFQTYCDILLQAKDYRNLISMTNASAQSKSAPWWVYLDRARAKKAIDDRQGSLDEYSKAIEVASAAKDDASVEAIVKSIVDEIGIEAAKVRIFALADKGDNRYRMMMSSLLQTDNDIPGALEWAEKVMNDTNVDPVMLDASRQRAATLYLRSNPPQTAKAVSVYRRLIDKNPNDLIALNNLACAMILPDSGYSAKEALEYSQQAYKLVQQSGDVNPYIYDTQGNILVLVGQFQEGINILRQALDKQPIPDACYHLGQAYLNLPTPRTSDAEEVLTQGLAILDAQSKDEQPIDTDLKSKIEKALERAKPAKAT